MEHVHKAVVSVEGDAIRRGVMRDEADARVPPGLVARGELAQAGEGLPVPRLDMVARSDQQMLAVAGVGQSDRTGLRGHWYVSDFRHVRQAMDHEGCGGAFRANEDGAFGFVGAEIQVEDAEAAGIDARANGFGIAVGLFKVENEGRGRRVWLWPDTVRRGTP